jgi:hypothetical protein
MANLGEHELIDAGLTSLAGIFGFDPKQLMRNLVAARAVNWAYDPLAGGAYSTASSRLAFLDAPKSKIQFNGVG